MCFVNDYDWCAAVSATTSGPADAPTRCDECGATVPAGAALHHTFMQEHEECRRCEEGACACPGRDDCHDCACPEPDFGETFDYDRCDDCDRFLRAVEAAELAAGCRAAEALPPLGAMITAVNDGGCHEAKKYWRFARRTFPELVASGYLGRLWRRCFG